MTHREKLFLPVVVALGASCAGPSTSEVTGNESTSTSTEGSTERSIDIPMLTKEVLEERAKLARGGRLLVPRSGGEVRIATPQTMLDALDIPAELTPSVVSLVTPHAEAAFDAAQWGVLAPRRGGSFVVLSTGQSNSTTVRSEPGTDFLNDGTVAGDAVTFTIRVNVPAGVNRFTFDYNFLSSEYPEFVNSAFNDAFTVRITDRNGTRQALAPVSVNSAAFQPASDTLVGPSSTFPFRLYVNTPTGVDTIFDNGGLMDAGITDFQRVEVEVADAGVATLEFDIRDVGDGILDSAVILDNFSFATVATLDPSPLDSTDPTDPAQGMIEASTSRVTTDLARLTTGGRPVLGVIADGTTQLLLRSVVPGPQPVTFQLNAAMEEQGGLSAHDATTLTWSNSINVNPVVSGGKHYAFALYRAPANFLRPGSIAMDDALKSRAIQLTMTQGAMVRSVPLDVIRRPVVVVPDMWSSCTSWTNAAIWRASESESGPPSGTPNFLEIECAQYSPHLGLTHAETTGVVASAILDVITLTRERGVAATQVDLVGHGFGGLVARRYLGRGGYRNPTNFGSGDANRFVSINTPHRGARMACEISEFRKYQKEIGHWENLANPAESVKTEFENAQVLIDDALGQVGLDDMRLDSPHIAALPAITVPTHALFTQNGLAIPVSTATEGAFGPVTNMLDNPLGNLKVVYTNLINTSRRLPDGAAFTQLQRLQRLYGRASIFFCDAGACGAGNPPNTDHDLFTTVTEQRGGLIGAHTTQFSALMGQALTAHSRVNANPAHSTRLNDLLDARLEAGAFAPGLAAPGPGACPPQPTDLLATPDVGIKAITRDLQILSPTPNTVVTPGGTVRVVIQPLNNFQPRVIVVQGGGIAHVLTAPPFEMDISVPHEAIGTFSVRAMAFSGGGNIAFAPQVNTPVNLTATLNSIELLGGDIVLDRPGRTRQLRVIGNYSDGIERDLSTSAQGTIYSVSNAGTLPFASVTTTGLLTALRAGDVTISASNGIQRTSVSVRVGASRCGDRVIDAGEACDDGNNNNGDGCSATCTFENNPPIARCSNPDVCNAPGVCHATVTGLGNGSTDPDNNPLSFTQSPAGPYSVGSHAVTVTVSDGQLQSQCIASLDVNDCEAPDLTCPGNFAVECTGSGGATVTPPPGGVTDNCGATVASPATGFRALGQHQLAYTASDAAGNQDTCSTTVTVLDTIGPVGTATAIPLLAWPPLQDYRTIDLSACGIQVVDACTGTVAPTIHQAQINCVTSDELDNAPTWTDGETVNDIVVTGPTTVRLRAEHDLASDGRVYTIHFKVFDTAGNMSIGTCPVRVRPAHCPPGGDGAPSCTPTDSGAKFSVCR